jgi:hypothetical protein
MQGDHNMRQTKSPSASTSMRIDAAKLNYFAEHCCKKYSYNNLMERIIKFIEARPDFKKEVFAK